MKPVTIYPGYFLIDTDAWVAQRIGEPSDIHTRELAEFLRCEAGPVGAALRGDGRCLSTDPEQ